RYQVELGFEEGELTGERLFGDYPDGQPAPLPAPALPPVRLRPREQSGVIPCPTPDSPSRTAQTSSATCSSTTRPPMQSSARRPTSTSTTTACSSTRSSRTTTAGRASPRAS